MRKLRILTAMSGCVAAMAVFVWAQSRKPGLWEMTSTQTWIQSPFPAGAPAPASGRHTSKVCVTQEQLDKYGAIVPQMRGCQVSNLVKKTNGMTAEMVCSGPMSGKGTLESTAVDSEHAVGKIHFVGSIQMGPDSKPVEWRVESSSVYKGADCGDVKPLTTPVK